MGKRTASHVALPLVQARMCGIVDKLRIVFRNIKPTRFILTRANTTTLWSIHVSLYRLSVLAFADVAFMTQFAKHTREPNIFQTFLLQLTIPLVSSDCSRDRGKSYLEGQIYDSSSLCGITFFRSHGLYSEGIVAQMLHKKEPHIDSQDDAINLRHPCAPVQLRLAVRSFTATSKCSEVMTLAAQASINASLLLSSRWFAFDLPQPAVQSTTSCRILSF